MLPDKKIIAFDLDGTLTESKSPITEEMADLLKRLIKQKMVIVTSGGKFGQFMTQFLPPFSREDFFPSLPNLILLPTSASQRYEFNEEKKEWILTDKEPLREDVREKIKKLLKEIIIDSDLYEIPPNPTGDIVEDRDTQITFSALGQLAPIEAKRSWDPDQKKRKKIKAVLEPSLPEVSLLINAYSSIDILPKGFNKAVGIERFLNKLSFLKSDVLFIGDGLFPGGNDYSLCEAGFETISVKGPKDVEAIIEQWIG